MKGIAVKDPRRLYGTANEKFFSDVMKNHGAAEMEKSLLIICIRQWQKRFLLADYIFKQSKLHPTNAGIS